MRVGGPRAGEVGVGSWIERRARVHPRRVALIAGERALTYAALAGRVRRLASGLAGLGVAHGDRIAWLGPNHPAFLESFFAAGLLGAALAPVNHRLSTDAIAAIVADTEPTVLVIHGEIAPPTTSPSVRALLVDVPADDAASYEALIAGSPDRAIDEPVGLDDLCLLPHTSGTTGTPKGVMLSHGNVTWNVVNFMTCADFRSDDVTIAIAPFFRVGGIGVNVLPVLCLGGTVVVPQDPGADGILWLIERHRVTVGFGNPDLLDALVHSKLWPTVDLSSIRFFLTGGAPVPERLIRTYDDRRIPLLQGYGLSEAGPLALLLDAEGSRERIGSAGRPPMFVDLRIVDADGREVGAGDTGELLVRGPNVMAGYWRRPDETSAVLTANGWLHTGDAARMDEDGYFWIVDRFADRFVSAGRTVYPADVERALLGHPAVADAGVTAIAGDGGGEAPAAFVVLTSGSTATKEELRRYAASRLDAHARPVSVVIVDRLPRNSVGKLMRDELRGRTG
jgi:fatty-acyl-CoA synthase